MKRQPKNVTRRLKQDVYETLIIRRQDVRLRRRIYNVFKTLVLRRRIYNVYKTLVMRRLKYNVYEI